MSSTSSTAAPPPIEVKNLTMAYGNKLIQKDLNFTIDKGEVCIIMGGSGCGKSTLMKHMIGLQKPSRGEVFLLGKDLWKISDEERDALLRRVGVTYQGGGLWSSMTLAENIALPLRRHTGLSDRHIADIASLKLALVGLGGYENYYPSEISGGMQKRAGIARAMALDPEIIFFDEPSAGLDPITSNQLDELIIELKESLDMTFVVVTHELPSIFAIGTDSVFLDAQSKTMIAQGDPNRLLVESQNPKVIEFLTRGEGAAHAQ